MNDKEALYTIFVKFGQKKHLEQLQSGILYCKTVRDFAKIEEGDVRHDPHEGISNLIPMNDGILEMKAEDSPNAPWYKFGFKKGLFTSYHHGNIFCMSRFIINTNSEYSQIELNPGFDKFGDHYLVVMNQPIFFERLKVAIDKTNLNVSGKIVEYAKVGKQIRERSVFVKDECHSWQVEYRIHFDTQMEEPLLFEMGDISDITMISSLPKSRKFDFKVGIISN